MKRTITIGPFSWQFTNVNTEMKLAGHSHFAEVKLGFTTLGQINRGFPAFAETYQVIAEFLKESQTPFRNFKNEDVVEWLMTRLTLVVAEAQQILKWGGDFRLTRVELAVRGVPDKIGHADGFTVYTVEDEP